MHSVFDERALDYDRWFDDNALVYRAEVAALRAALGTASGIGLEVGVGSGRFAAPLGVQFGVDPARGMLQLARRRGICVCQAMGERLPFPAGRFDFALLITVDPFVPDVLALLLELRRVLRPGGSVSVGLVDKDSPLGREYEAQKDADPFYRAARFHSSAELIAFLQQAGFVELRVKQTLIGAPSETVTTTKVQAGYAAPSLEVRDGYGSGAFVVLNAVKV